MPWALLLCSAAVVVAAMSLRYPPEVLAAATVLPEQGGLRWIIAAALGLSAAGLAVAGRHSLRKRPGRVAAAELLVFPAFLAYEWLALTPKWRPVDYAAILVALAVVAWGLARDRARWGKLGLTGRNFLPAARLAALPTVLMLAAVAALARCLGPVIQPRKRAVSLAVYPLYGLVQLTVFQVFLITRLRRLGGGPAACIVVAGGIFGLLHWPNLPLAAGCAITGMVWAWVYLRRPNVYVLAISMAFVAAVYLNVLPVTWTQNLRAGPIYVFRIVEGL